MNEYLKKELFDKVLLAQSGPSNYWFELSFGNDSFHLIAGISHSKMFVGASVKLVDYSSMNNEPLTNKRVEEEKKLNEAIVIMNDFLRKGDHELNHGLRIKMFNDMTKSCKEQGKDSSWVAEYLNLDPEVMSRVTA